MERHCELVIEDGEAIPGGATALVLDRAALLVRVGGNEELLAELAGLFAEECPGRLTAIRQAVEAGDPVALQRTAQCLKDALGLFDAPAAIEAATELEELGRSAALDRADEVFAVLDEETHRLLAALAVCG